MVIDSNKSINKINTNIEGLDQLLYGGIPDGSQIIITGGPGAGKTLLSFEFLYKSALAGFPGIFFTFDEDADQIISNAKNAFPEFKDIDSLIENKKIIISNQDTGVNSIEMNDAIYQFGRLISNIEKFISSTEAKRVVIDSISLLDIMMSADETVYRKSMMAMISDLKRLKIISFVTAEMESLERAHMKFKSEYFIFDGIIALYEENREKSRKWGAEIIKMRGSKHNFNTTPYEITPSGFKFYSTEK
jgi:circadian clock protein KaiC